MGDVPGDRVDSEAGVPLQEGTEAWRERARSIGVEAPLRASSRAFGQRLIVDEESGADTPPATTHGDTRHGLNEEYATPPHASPPVPRPGTYTLGCGAGYTHTGRPSFTPSPGSQLRYRPTTTMPNTHT